MEAIVGSTEYLADEAATLAFARRFAAAVELPCSVALIGDLGAGKTTFVRGVLRALGVTGAIKSPTYALVESYETTKGEVHHLDAYRIESVDDFEARGGFEYFASPSIRFVEWAERLQGAVPFDLELRFDFEGEGRRVTIAPLPPSGGGGVTLVASGSGGEGGGSCERDDGSSLRPPPLPNPLPRGERGSKL